MAKGEQLGKNAEEVVKTAANSYPDRPTLARAKNPQHSRVTNGTALLPGIDGRSAWVRRCKDIISEHIGDLGGIDNVSAAERSLVRRAAVLSVELERLEGAFAVAGAVDPETLDLYGRVAGNLRRLLEAIGLQRRPRDTSLDLQTYLCMKAQSCDAGELREAAE